MQTARSMTLGALLGVLLWAAPGLADPLKVVATTSDLGGLAEIVGGPDAEVTVLGAGTQNPHFVDPKPSFLRALAGADALVETGLELEVGWLPTLVQNARNARILAGAKGRIVAAEAIAPLDLPAGTVDRTMGDVHPYGNPHFLVDPIQGVRVAALLRDRFSDLRPEAAAGFAARYDAFRKSVGERLVGAALAGKYDFEKLALLAEHGRLADFLRSQGDEGRLGGWLGALVPFRGAKAVGDHNIWPYFARRYGLEVVAHLEPKPGVPPTTKHIREVIERMKAENVGLILATAYFDPSHARFVAGETGARVVEIADQVGARPGAGDYLSACDYNVRALLAAMKRGAS